MKICSKCKLSKEESEFPTDKRLVSGLLAWCKICNSTKNRIYKNNHPDETRIQNKNWRAENPARARKIYRKNALWTRYKLSLRDFDVLLEEQGSRCKICEELMVKPCVDHCHSTGKIRGLLCQHCNRGLGGFRDSSKVLLAAIAYLDTP